MFTTVDRAGARFGLGPTHEEAFARVVGRDLRSYRQLPALVYQVQTKFRDEPRPRFGLLRTREFVMKDAYSFDLDADGCAASFDRVAGAYRRIFERCGLDTVAVRADSGGMGGDASTEFVALADVGEDVIVSYADGAAANLELATASLTPPDEPEQVAMTAVHTPDCRTIDEVVGAIADVPVERFVKTLLYEVGTAAGSRLVAVCVRGDREVNEVKLGNALAAETLRLADDDRVRGATGASPGFAGPVDLPGDVEVLADHNLAGVQGFVCGANRSDHHLRDVWWGRDLPVPPMADLDLVQAGDVDAAGRPVQLRRGIEVGHIFQLGTHYCASLGVSVLDGAGRETTPWMGSYGIGISRLAAALVEQHHDDRGIVWPPSVAPHDVVIVQAAAGDPVQTELARRAYEELHVAGVDVLWDDRDARAGVKFADAELVGIPCRLVVGRDAVDGAVELGDRRTGDREVLALDDAIARLTDDRPPS
jgi:prolyl-tRNA synthetase